MPCAFPGFPHRPASFFSLFPSPSPQSLSVPLPSSSVVPPVFFWLLFLSEVFPSGGFCPYAWSSRLGRNLPDGCPVPSGRSEQSFFSPLFDDASVLCHPCCIPAWPSPPLRRSFLLLASLAYWDLSPSALPLPHPLPCLHLLLLDEVHLHLLHFHLLHLLLPHLLHHFLLHLLYHLLHSHLLHFLPPHVHHFLHLLHHFLQQVHFLDLPHQRLLLVHQLCHLLCQIPGMHAKSPLRRVY